MRPHRGPENGVPENGGPGNGGPENGPDRAARVPRGARALVRITTAREDRSLLLADLDERFRAIADAEGEAAARRWYRLQALRGAVGLFRPDFERARRGTWAGTAGDVRQGLRALRRRPLYTFGVVGTLSVGLASAAVVAAVAWHVWLAPMPFPDPDRVVRLFELEPVDGPESRSGSAGGSDSERSRWRLSPPLLEDLRRREWQSVSAVAGVSSNVVDWAREEGTTRLSAVVVSREAFEILGITPLAGRVFSDDRDAAEVVLTEAFWQRAFGSDPAVVGAVDLLLGDEPHRVVGVVALPSGYPSAGDLLLRLDYEPSQLTDGMRGARYLDVIARVRPERSIEDAAAEMDRFVAELGRTQANHAGWGGDAVPLSEELLRSYRGVLALLLTAGCAFFLLAVVNVIGLVASRTLEVADARAVRLALGASEGRLLRGAIVESVLLGSAAAVAGLAVSLSLMGPLRGLIPAGVPRASDIALGPGAGSGIVVAALLAGGVVGALGYLLSLSAPAGLRRAARATTRGDQRARGAIVVSQVALTMLLATAGAGILRHIVSLQRVDLGFQADGVASTQVSLTGGRYATREARLTLWRTLLERLEGRGLEVAVATSPPMARVNMPWGYRRDAADEQAFAQYHIVSPAFFDLLGVELVEGRTFTADDRAAGEPVVVINDLLAERVFGDASAVGRTIDVLRDTKTVVGVVRATRHFGPDTDAPDEIYAPFEQDPWPHAELMVRGEPSGIGAAVANVLDEVDPVLAPAPVASYERFVEGWFASLRLQLVIVGLLAVVGTTLATLGLYALVAYRVSMRRREIGLRMALGASGATTFSSVVRQGAGLAGWGVAAGAVAWYGLAPVVQGLLGDVPVRDPLVPAVVAALVVLVAVAASAVPARRGVTVDPAIALRAE